MNIWKKLKQKLCDHHFHLDDLKRNGPEFENTDNRVTWSCFKCGKSFAAHCGLNIAPKHGYIVQNKEQTK